METPKQKNRTELFGAELIQHVWRDSWGYIKTIVDVLREPVLILDKNFCVIAANDPFYRTFQVEIKDTENKIVYDLGNGQWNIPALRKLLEDILPKNTFFKGFEVDHDFPIIGRKIMILNARQIYFNDDRTTELYPPIILLAIEDITEMMAVAEVLATHTQELETKFTTQTLKFELQVNKLKEEIADFKKNR
ncbi:MAG: hypothetical protein A2571_02455 [Candidatus Vogelbacteria bacterium RIFOXYD1_FULL_44_32]|uniref:PAS domain-containing protein n=1 Tax=Candidatus Vogelbacteria bacterium RIFOXYD1_FULL_44_32 TaxID=1802438 RepID=A0A1G2QDL3_9BACT|nr:MAG: hypothetical protein A2571_02455 [Candidatus Vogelbacteria bacterium RIFOXYD1_FULL_44_32]